MGRPTILRIPEGKKLSTPLQTGIEKLIGDDFIIETFTDGNNVKKAIFQRMEALRLGFTFLLSAQGRNFVDLDDCAKTACEYVKKNLDNLENAQSCLQEYARMLMDVLMWQFDLTFQQTLEQLNRAEQYYLLTQVRPVVATLSDSSKKGEMSQFMLQCDTPTQAFSKQTIDELNLIKTFSHTHKITSPSMPEWFEPLSPEIKTFLFWVLTEKGKTRMDVIRILKKLKTTWETNKPSLNETTKEQIANYCFTRNAKTLPAWLADFPEGAKLLISEGIEKSQFSALLEKTIALIHKHSLPETYQLPPWYFFLADYEQKLLLKALNCIDDLKMITLSSRLRSLPGIANRAIHDTFYIDDQGQVTEKFTNRERFAHIVSRDIFSWPIILQSEYIVRNLSMLQNRSPSIMTTLVSADNHPLTNFIKQLFPGVADIIDTLHPDTKLHQLLSKALKNNPYMTHVNLPVNYYGGLFSWDENILIQIRRFKCDEHLSVLKPIIEDAERLLEKKDVGDVAPWHAVNLHLLAIFQMIGQELGKFSPDKKPGSYGSCVSGKDRYGVLLSYVTAMKKIYSDTGEWPMFEHGNNTRLNDLVLTILETKHQSHQAHLNARGAKGQKNLKGYLPIIARDYDSNWLEEQDLLASNNELKVIVGASNTLNGDGVRLFKCLHLGKEMCANLNEQINAIVFEETFWQSQGSGGMPNGIKNIRAQFQSEKKASTVRDWIAFTSWSRSRSSGKMSALSSSGGECSPEVVLAFILKDVEDSLTNRFSVGRKQHTQCFYDIFRPLIACQSIDDVGKNGEKIRTDLADFFDTIKESKDECRKDTTSDVWHFF